MRILCLLLLIGSSFIVTSNARAAQAKAEAEADSVVTFKFMPTKDAFYSPYNGNDAELKRLFTLVKQYRSQIRAGEMPVYVNGYCQSESSESKNLKIAAIRANRVKSELITLQGLKESDFRTRNFASSCDGEKDIVVVKFFIPMSEAGGQQTGSRINADDIEGDGKPIYTEPQREQRAPEVVEPQEKPITSAKREHDPYLISLRSNLLYDAMALPTLGVEWRISRDFGFVANASYCYWGSKHGNIQKIWMISPEVRWYLLRNKRLYTGVAGNAGEFNIFKYPFGSLVSKSSGYQGNFWNVGLTLGYQLYLSRSFSIDFNVGLGYTRFEYDKFGMVDRTRIYKAKECTKNFWGPTQAGISLMWTFGASKLH